MIKKNRKYIFAIILTNLVCGWFFVMRTNHQQVITIYIFLFLLFFLSNIIKRILAKKKISHPLLLLSINFLRIFACVLFLLPIFSNLEPPNKPYVYSFFIAYFSGIFMEIFLAKGKALIK